MRRTNCMHDPKVVRDGRANPILEAHHEDSRTIAVDLEAAIREQQRGLMNQSLSPLCALNAIARAITALGLILSPFAAGLAARKASHSSIVEPLAHV